MSPNESQTTSQHCYSLYLITVINFMAVIIHYSNMRTIAPMTNCSPTTVRKYRGSAEDKSEGTVGANPSEANLTKSSSYNYGQSQPSLANALCGAPCEAGEALACSKPQSIMLIPPRAVPRCWPIGATFMQILPDSEILIELRFSRGHPSFRGQSSHL